MLGRDKLTVGLWLVAVTAAAAAVTLAAPGRRLVVVAVIVAVAALAAQDARIRCLDRRRMRRRWRAEAGVISSAGHVRGVVRSLDEQVQEMARRQAEDSVAIEARLDWQDAQIRAVYTVLGVLGISGGARVPAKGAGQDGQVRKIGLAKDEAS